MNQEEKRQKIFDLLKSYLDEKDNNTDWVSYSGPHVGFEEYRAAFDSLLDGWLVFGKKCREFELLFPENMGKKLGTLTNSGSSANLLMVSTLLSKNKCPKKYRLEKGDKFITPIVCFPTTINPLIQSGFEPIFVDVDIPSLSLIHI